MTGFWRRALLSALAAMLAETAGEAATTNGPGVEIVGTELRIAVPDGRILSGQDVVGTALGLRNEDGQKMLVKIEEVLADPLDPTGKILLYRFTAQDRAGAWRPICSPAPDGLPLAVPQPGADGRIVIWCNSGALGKCVRFGYHPWESLPDGTSLARYHRACVNMVRADYTGTDHPTTRNGMLIDVFDYAGIQSPEIGPSNMPFEAAWGEDGAVCVAHVRVPQNMSLERLASEDSRVAGRVGQACTVEVAKAWGEPLVFNRSRGNGIPGR